MALQRIFYTSRIAPAEAHRGDDLAREIAGTSDVRNAQRGLTGSLAFVDGHFMQVIEGEQDPIERLFEAICRDARHVDVRLIDAQFVPARQFAQWGMACLVDRLEAPPLHRELLTEIRLLAGQNARQSIEQIRRLLVDREEMASPIA